MPRIARRVRSARPFCVLATPPLEATSAAFLIRHLLFAIYLLTPSPLRVPPPTPLLRVLSLPQQRLESRPRFWYSPAMSTEWSDSIVIADLTDEPALSEELSAIADRLSAKGNATPSVVLNFANVTYVNSSNLAGLLKIRKILTEKGRGLRLCSLSEDVQSVMSVTGLDKVFRFAPDPMMALAGLQIEDEKRTNG